jgi:L-threonylcarbamoyladenylate synthase
MNQVEKGIEILKQGGIVIFPTDTVYGLGASVFNEKAVRRVFEVKNRPLSMALPVLVSGIAQLKEIVTDMPDIVDRLAKRFWPGALTLVLFKSGKVPGIVTADEPTIAVRIPAHLVPLALIEGLGAPIIGTSANISGQPSPVTADSARRQLADKVDLIIDGGTSPGGKESTILDLTKGKPVILREGPISLSDILRMTK